MVRRCRIQLDYKHFNILGKQIHFKKCFYSNTLNQKYILVVNGRPAQSHFPSPAAAQDLFTERADGRAIHTAVVGITWISLKGTFDKYFKEIGCKIQE